MAKHPFDERYKLVPRKISSLMAKQPKNPPPKRARNVGKSKRTQLSASSSTGSPPSDNKDLPSTKLSPRKISSLMAKQPKNPPPKRARNVGKSKRTQLSASSSTGSPPSDNKDLPSTKLSPRSYSRALKDDPNMSKEQRETRGMFKNLGRALHNFARMLKKGYCKKAKVKDYEYYKTRMLLAKKDKDEQVLLAKDQAWIESSSDSDQEINVNMVFTAQIKKVLSDSEASSSSADEKISELRILWFMNYLEEQTDGEAMINSIKNDKSMWFDQDKKIQKINRLARSLLIQGLSNDIYSIIESNKTAKDLWDALARHMLGYEYREQDRKAVVLYEYETFKATEGELLLDTYIRFLQVINDLKKCGYSKDNCELNFKFLNNLQPEWKQYATMMRQNKNLIDINIDALYNILKQNQGDVNDAIKEKVVVSLDSEGSDADDFSELKKITALLAKAFNRRKFYSKSTNNNLRTSFTSHSANKKQEFVKSDDKKVEKKDDEKKRDMSKVKCYNCKKEGHFAKDCKIVKNQAWMESSSDSDQEINANMVFMVQIKKVLSDSETSSSSADDKIFEVSYYLSESESEFEYETSEYYDNTTTYGLFVNDNDDQEIFHDCENFPKNLIESQINHNESVVDHNDYEGIDKLIQKFNQKDC
nr:hypothetical protein [Tanacetum cinerariifolium]